MWLGCLFALLVIAPHEINTQELKRTEINEVECHKVQQAFPGDEVTIHYEGRLQDFGTKFDSSLDRGEPITFELGRGRVIKGWEQGLVGTCPGQKLVLEIPSELAYGDRGIGDVIPPEADLIFELELLSIKAQKVKVDILSGNPCSSDDKTRDKDVVKINFVLRQEDGKHLHSTQPGEPIEVTIGELGIKGWDDALTGACPGEQRRVFIPYELAYGADGVEDFVDPESNLILEVAFEQKRDRVLNFLDRISSGRLDFG